jgi:amphi-Trp domain-containing protein
MEAQERRVMAKKDGPKAQRKRGRFQHELTLSADAAATYLEELAGKLRSGAVTIGEGDGALRTAIHGDIELEVEARRGKRKARIDLSLAFRDAGEGVSAPADGSSPVATIPDEMSF